MKLTIFIIIILFSSTSYSGENKRSKSINFEDELVEGINRKSLDSVNQLSEFEANQRKHLYRKRSGFVDRDRLVMDELKLKH
jgi:hypothetical protein